MERKDTSRKGASRMAHFSNSAASLSRFRSADDGATLVELALASSILFAMVFGIIMIGLALYTYDFVGDAARMGTRYAIVRGSDCVGFSDCNANETQIQSYLRGIAYPGIDSSRIQVSAAWYTVTQSGTYPALVTTVTPCATSTPGLCDIPGNAVRVTVNYTMPFSIPYWRATTLTMSARSQLVISQ